MSGRKGTHFRSSLSGTGGRRKKGAAGRKELEDPVTQVSALQGTEDRSTPDGFLSSSPQKGRYISQLSQSPSPPLGKTKKQINQEIVADTSIDEFTQDEVIDTGEEEKEEQEDRRENEVKTEEEDGKAKEKSLKTISSFLQELDREIQRCGPIPKCPRQTSRKACRFELPIDVTVLQGLSAVEYLLDYCIVATDKEQAYQKIFHKHCKMHIEDALKTEHLQSALEDHFCQSFVQGEVTTLLEYVNWEPGSYIHERSFIALAALFERILCHLDNNSSLDGNRKDELEVADFSGLDEKLEGLEINQPLKNLLAFIQNS